MIVATALIVVIIPIGIATSHLRTYMLSAMSHTVSATYEPEGVGYEPQGIGYEKQGFGYAPPRVRL